MATKRYLSHVMRKTNNVIFDQVRHKSSCTNTEDSQKLEVLDLESRCTHNCTFLVAKTKALTSFTVMAKLVCAFVFAYAICWFSHDVAKDSVIMRLTCVCSRLAEWLPCWARASHLALHVSCNICEISYCTFFPAWCLGWDFKFTISVPSVQV